MLWQMLSNLLVCSIAAAVFQPVAGRICNVSDAYDFSYGIANAADCTVLEVQHSVALTATSFSASSLTVDNQNLTIQSNTTSPEVIFDFGSYALNSKIFVTGVSTFTFQDMTLQNYASTTVQNGSVNSFLPLFNVESTAQMHIRNVRFLVDAGRCSLDPDYVSELATPRTSW